MYLGGADVNKVDKNGTSALMFAAENGNIKIFNILLTRKANFTVINDDDDTAFKLAVGAGHLHIIRALLKCGGDMQGRLFYAVQTNNLPLAHLIMTYAKDLNYIPLIKCAATNGYTGMILLLARDEEKMNIALIKAAENGDVEMVRALLARDAKVDAKDFAGHTALSRACEHGHLNVVNLLLAHSGTLKTIDWQADCGSTALILAAREEMKSFFNSESKNTFFLPSPLVKIIGEYIIPAQSAKLGKHR